MEGAAERSVEHALVRATDRFDSRPTRLVCAVAAFTMGASTESRYGTATMSIGPSPNASVSTSPAREYPPRRYTPAASIRPSGEIASDDHWIYLLVGNDCDQPIDELLLLGRE